MTSKPKWALVILVLLISDSQPTAAQGEVTGSFAIMRSSDQGSSAYTVIYRYPSVVPPGRNATFTIIVEVDSLTGLKAYLISYGVSVSLSLPSGTLFAQLNQSTPRLYQGSHWGPVNITIPLGQSASVGGGVGNVTITFFGDVWYDNPILFDYPESGAHTVGALAVGSGGPSGSSLNPLFLTALAGGAAAILALVAALGRRLFRRL